eukprot:Platyproteum_vivax@DN14675_c0_g1_i1.p1
MEDDVGYKIMEMCEDRTKDKRLFEIVENDEIFKGLHTRTEAIKQIINDLQEEAWVSASLGKKVNGKGRLEGGLPLEMQLQLYEWLQNEVTKFTKVALNIPSEFLESNLEWYNNSVKRIQIKGIWHRLGAFRNNIITRFEIAQIRTAFSMCKTWPTKLEFRNCNLSERTLQDIAAVINEHPIGFETIVFIDEPAIWNEGLAFFVDRIRHTSLQNTKNLALFSENPEFTGKSLPFVGKVRRDEGRRVAEGVFRNILKQQCPNMEVSFGGAKWVKGNINKIQIGKKWHTLGNCDKIPLTKRTIAMTKSAMNLCAKWPKELRFSRTKLNAALAVDVADLINSHPVGFSNIIFWNETDMNNETLQIIADNVTKDALRKIRRLVIYCGLSGKPGGDAIHTLLEKCGDYIWRLEISVNQSLGILGLEAVFKPFEDPQKKKKIDSLFLWDFK